MNQSKKKKYCGGGELHCYFAFILYTLHYFGILINVFMCFVYMKKT